MAKQNEKLAYWYRVEGETAMDLVRDIASLKCSCESVVVADCYSCRAKEILRKA